MKLWPLLICLNLFLISCEDAVSEKSTTTAKAESVHYRNDSLHFEIDIPQEWNLRINKNNPKSVGFFEPIQDSLDAFQENLVIWQEDIPIDLNDSLYAQAAKTQLQISQPDLMIRSLGWLPLGEERMDAFQFDFISKDSSRYRVFGYTFLKNRRGYNFSFSTELEHADVYESKFKKILQTFQPKP